MPAGTDTAVVHTAGDAPTDWALVVRDGGEVLEARCRVPYDGDLRYSTEERSNSPRKNSDFALSVETVVDRYLRESGASAPRALLVARAREELADAAVQERDGTSDDSSDDCLGGVAEGLVGEAEIVIDLDESQYERLRTLYETAVGAGYSHGFGTFAHNNTDVQMTVTVAGDEVDLETGKRLGDTADGGDR